MKEKKTLKQRITEWWDWLGDSGQGAFIGSAVATAITGGIAIAVGKRKENAWIQASNDICDEESKLAYQRGLKDGQVKAYYNLLTDPANTFKKMGMDVKTF